MVQRLSFGHIRSQLLWLQIMIKTKTMIPKWSTCWRRWEYNVTFIVSSAVLLENEQLMIQSLVSICSGIKFVWSLSENTTQYFSCFYQNKAQCISITWARTVTIIFFTRSETNKGMKGTFDISLAKHLGRDEINQGACNFFVMDQERRAFRVSLGIHWLCIHPTHHRPSRVGPRWCEELKPLITS